MAIVNAKLLSQVATSLDIGCDVLHFGNRKLEKQLSAENMSGDTVYVTEADGGKIIDGSLNTEAAGEGDKAVARSETPITVAPIVGTYQLSQEQLDLMIKESEFADKMVARMVDKVNGKAADCIASGCRAVVVEKDSSTSAIKTDDLVAAFFDSLASIEASKIKGKIYGLGNSLTLNAMARGLAQGTAGIGIQSHGGELWQRNLANFGGLDWSKSGILGTVTQSASVNGIDQVTGYSKVVDPCGSGFYVIDKVTIHLSSSVTLAAGDAVTPITVAGWCMTDALGNSTGIPLSLEGTVDAAVTSSQSVVVKLSRPIHAAALDPLRNGYVPGFVNEGGEPSGLTLVAVSVLSADKTYYKPVLMWNENDFYVAVKGLSPMKASDSATIPGGFTDKGILPLRGTAWTEHATSQLNVRFDCMYGFMMKRGIAGVKVYIEA